MSFSDHTRWELLTTLMSDGFFVVQDQRLVYVNEAFERLIGARSDELLGQRFVNFVHPDQRTAVLDRYKKRIQGLPVEKHYELKLLKADGESTLESWLEVDSLRDDQQQVVVAGTVRDISSFKALKQELNQTRQQLTTIMDNMADTVYQTDMDGIVTLMSGCVEALLGYTSDEMIGTRLADYYWSPQERQKVVDAITANHGKVTNVEARLRRKDGSAVWISTNAYIKLNEKGEPQSIEGIARDVSKQKELEQKLEKLALTDSLTGLPNRRALMDELHHCYMRSHKQQTDLSIIYLDINGFKKVNDQFGHLVGDNLLLHVALTLSGHVSGSKVFGRLSGDEFLFILPGMDSEQAQKFARILNDDISARPLLQKETTIPVAIAIGISSRQDDDPSEYSLLDRADKAMYLAKNSGQPFEVL